MVEVTLVSTYASVVTVSAEYFSVKNNRLKHRRLPSDETICSAIFVTETKTRTIIICSRFEATNNIFNCFNEFGINVMNRRTNQARSWK